MGIREDVQSHLAADATLSNLLTGGILAVEEVKRSEPDAASAFDANNELLPCANVKLEVQNPRDEAHDRGAEQFFTVSFYQRAGRDVIDDALDRVYILLHRQHVANAYIEHADDTPDLPEPALDARMRLSRYQAIRIRDSS